MHFVPWKTIDLDGAFRITAPDSISEEVIQEVSNGITFKFNGKLEKIKLEILLTAPFEWEDTCIRIGNGRQTEGCCRYKS